MVLAAAPLGLWLRGAGRGLFCPIFPSHLHFQPLRGHLCLALAAEDGSSRPEPAQGCQNHAAIAPAAFLPGRGAGAVRHGSANETEPVPAMFAAFPRFIA